MKKLVQAELNQKLLSDDGGRGDLPRILTEDGSTRFYTGHAFRAFREITTADDFVIEAMVPVNVILKSFSVELIDGEAKVETVVGGTPGGTFDADLPMFARNNMTGTPSYTRQSTLIEGGTHTGGTVLDVLYIKTASATAQARHVGVTQGDQRGILPGTYYFRVTFTGNSALGVLSATWDELP